MKKYLIMIIAVLMLIASSVSADSESLDVGKLKPFAMSDEILFPFGTNEDVIVNFFNSIENTANEVQFEVNFEGDSIEGDCLEVYYYNDAGEETVLYYEFSAEPEKKLQSFELYPTFSSAVNVDSEELKNKILQYFGISEDNYDKKESDETNEVLNPQPGTWPVDGTFSSGAKMSAAFRSVYQDTNIRLRTGQSQSQSGIVAMEFWVCTQEYWDNL